MSYPGLTYPVVERRFYMLFVKRHKTRNKGRAYCVYDQLEHRVPQIVYCSHSKTDAMNFMVIRASLMNLRVNRTLRMARGWV
jgi:hypothetical protein